MKTFTQILTEATSTGQMLAAKPEKGNPISNLFFNFGRKPDSLQVFTLRKDGWLRGERHDNGMMFRTVKLLKGVEDMPGHTAYAISFTYYPVEYTGYNDSKEDMKANHKRDKGWLWVLKSQGMPGIKSVIGWMNDQAGNWVP